MSRTRGESDVLLLFFALFFFLAEKKMTKRNNDEMETSLTLDQYIDNACAGYVGHPDRRLWIDPLDEKIDWLTEALDVFEPAIEKLCEKDDTLVLPEDSNFFVRVRSFVSFNDTKRSILEPVLHACFILLEQHLERLYHIRIRLEHENTKTWHESLDKILEQI